MCRQRKKKKIEIDLATESQRFFHPLQIASNLLTDAHMHVIDIFFKDCKKNQWKLKEKKLNHVILDPFL